MKLAVVFDEAGNILGAQESVASGGTHLKLVAGPNQHHAVLDVPTHHKGKKVEQVAHLLKVSGGAAAPVLVDKTKGA